ncbi:putative addiction module antidote protein [Bradyrhizobium sp. AZCC 1610]|uniref:addiction module antidote protein n=1 Tax=Bradyrhizobium sp. AZCC 1610 TaxID=3117020 RepID=UPI002FF3D354
MAKTARRSQYASTAQLEKFLNQAFQTTDSRQVCLALGEAVRAQNVTTIAIASGIERAHLYGAFVSERGPRLSTVTKVITALRLRLVTVQPSASTLERYGSQQPVHGHLRYSTPAGVAELLNPALATSNLRAICSTFGEIIRAQENVAEFARRIQIGRTRLYRSFMGDRSPEFTTVLTILGAFGLQLRVKRVSKRKASLDPYSTRSLGQSAEFGKSAEMVFPQQLPVEFPAMVEA